MIQLIEKNDTNWLTKTLESVRLQGFAVIKDVLSATFRSEVADAMYEVQRRILKEMGAERLERAGEIGVLRLMMKYHPVFMKFLETPEVLSVIDHTVSPTAVMHLQNGFILPPAQKKDEERFQHKFHQDFPRVLNGYLASINTFFAIDEFTKDNGATLVVPGSQQKSEKPDKEFMKHFSIPVVCPAGSMIVFDSTLWHAAGQNHSAQNRLAINHQFTRSYVKQQIDYVRALGDKIILPQKPRTQQLLGWYTRVVTSLDEYYKPEAERLYRKGQG